jgi:DNA mismatch repair protein MutL
MIKKLPKEVWSKIQAGEVIDGPSAIIRELIDNSLDANAKNVKVLVEDSGLSLIEVEDDGDGISYDDSFLLFTNHATSKISNFEDLNDLRTLGFRGEALYSIGSVSYVTIKSKNIKDEIGFELVLNGGKKIIHQKAPFSKGTKISVQKIFFNVPAREKFLEDKRKEFSKIKEVFFNKSFAGYITAFTFLSENKIIYEFASCENIEKRIKQIYPNLELGNMSIVNFSDISKKYQKFIEDFQISDIKLIFSNRFSYSKNRSIFHFSFNNRSALNENLLKRIKGFYINYLPKGFYPYFFMEIKMHPNYLDCNVHPAKKNIKITSENIFISSILQIINDKLNESQFSINNYKDESFISNHDIYSKENVEDKYKSINEIENRKFGIKENRFTNNFFYENEDLNEYDNEIINNNLFFEQKEEYQNIQEWQNSKEENDFYKLNNIDSIYQLWQNGKFLGQIFSTYLLFEFNEKLLIIDQHAADERISYNILIQNLNKKRRVLLFPKIIEINEEDIEKIIELFENAGIEITRFGKNKAQIFAIPDIVPSYDEDNFINQTIEFIKEDLQLKKIEIQEFVSQFYLHIIAKSACHLAIKQGDKLTEFEVKKLCEKLFKQNDFEKCPHGRPTFFIIDKESFEKFFLRKK